MNRLQSLMEQCIRESPFFGEKHLFWEGNSESPPFFPSAGRNPEKPAAWHQFPVLCSDRPSALAPSGSRRRRAGWPTICRRRERLIQFIPVLQGELDEPELLRMLRAPSAVLGRLAGEAQRRRSPDTSFQTFVGEFWPPRYANLLTHEVVTDTEDVFELRVTECVNATVFREAGLDGGRRPLLQPPCQEDGVTGLAGPLERGMRGCAPPDLNSFGLHGMRQTELWPRLPVRPLPRTAC